MAPTPAERPHESYEGTTPAPLLGGRKHLVEPTANFFWVNNLNGELQSGETFRAKQAFIKARRYRLQKEKRLQLLKDSIKPFPVSQINALSSRFTTAVQDAENNTQNEESQGKVMVNSALQPVFLDSFSSLPTRMTKEMRIYFHYYKNHCAKSCYPFAPTDMTIWWWQKALDQPALIQILLATSAMHAASLSLTSYQPPQLTRSAAWHCLRFRQETLQSLQKILSHSTKRALEAALLVIINLICTEGADADVEAVQAHMVGLQKVLQLLGGLDNLNDLAISAIYCAEYMRGLATNSVPVTPMSSRWKMKVLKESSLLDNSMTRDNFGSFGCQFFQSPIVELLELEVKSVIATFRQIVFGYETLAEKSLAANDVDCSVLALWGYQVLSLASADEIPSVCSTLRHTMLVHATVRIWDFAGLNCTGTLVGLLRKDLVNTYCLIWATSPELLLWVLFMGGLASQGRDGHWWWVTEFANIAIKLSLTNWDGLLVVLEGFCFKYRTMDKIVDDLWTEALQIIDPSRATVSGRL